MSNYSRWCDAHQLTEGPFLAINLTNNTQKLLDKNLRLFNRSQVGDWILTEAQRANNLIGKLVVLHWRESRDNSRIYIGICRNLRQTGVSEYGKPRFRLTMQDAWIEIGTSGVSFSRFVAGFTMNSRSPVLWASPACFTKPDAVLPPFGEEHFDRLRRVVVAGERRGPVDQVPHLAGHFDPLGDVIARSVSLGSMAQVARNVHDRIFWHKVATVWNDRCALTGISTALLLQPCRLIPYEESTASEKVAASNGLYLCAHLNMLMNAHLISFADDGALMLCDGIAANLRVLVLSSGHTHLSRKPSSKQASQLQRHRLASFEMGHRLSRVDEALV